jgi:hypothetical protein
LDDLENFPLLIIKKIAIRKLNRKRDKIKQVVSWVDSFSIFPFLDGNLWEKVMKVSVLLLNFNEKSIFFFSTHL